MILNGRNEARLKDFEGELCGEGHSVEQAVFDVADFAAVRAYFARIERLDVLVNNAISMTPRAMDALEPADFEKTYASAVTAAFEAVRAARPALRKAADAAGGGKRRQHRVHVRRCGTRCIYAQPGQASPFQYGPAKAALLQLSRHLAAELGAGTNSRERFGSRTVSSGRSFKGGSSLCRAAFGQDHARADRAGGGNSWTVAVPGVQGIELCYRRGPCGRWRLDGLGELEQ